MSFHTGQTFTYGETPSATKMQYLWDNDYALADGTGISDDAIIARHISGFDRSNLTVDSNPYKFRAYRSSDYSIATGTNKISLNAETFDTNNNFDSTTNFRYTAPVAGFYSFIGQMRLSCSNGNAFSVAIYKNGVQDALGDLIVTGTTFDQSFSVSSLMQLAASDYVELYCVNGDAGSRTIIGSAAQTFLAGHLVSRT